MSESCSHNCSTCGSNCGERTQESLLAPLHELSSVKKVFAVVSGKGGVGKSLVTSLLASATQKSGSQAAILDAMAIAARQYVLPAYYESALKEKLARDPETAEMHLTTLNYILGDLKFREPMLSRMIRNAKMMLYVQL